MVGVRVRVGARVRVRIRVRVGVRVRVGARVRVRIRVKDGYDWSRSIIVDHAQSPSFCLDASCLIDRPFSLNLSCLKDHGRHFLVECC